MPKHIVWGQCLQRQSLVWHIIKQVINYTFEKHRTGNNSQNGLLVFHPWRHSSCDCMHGGNASSQKFPSTPSPDTPSGFFTPRHIPPLWYYCKFPWLAVVVFLFTRQISVTRLDLTCLSTNIYSLSIQFMVRRKVFGVLNVLSINHFIYIGAS